MSRGTMILVFGSIAWAAAVALLYWFNQRRWRNSKTRRDLIEGIRTVRGMKDVLKTAEFPSTLSMYLERLRLEQKLSCHNLDCAAFGRHKCHDGNCKQHAGKA